MKLQSLGSNQTLMTRHDDIQILFSYSTPVAAYIPTQGYFRTEQKWSNTTTRHIQKFIQDVAEHKPQSFFDNLA